VGHGENGWFVFYPKGEVLFMAGVMTDDPGVTIDDVLVELPPQRCWPKRRDPRCS